MLRPPRPMSEPLLLGVDAGTSIIKAVAFAFPGNRVATVVAVCGSVVAGWVFYLVCERPIHRLARRLKGARLTGAPVPVPPSEDAAAAEAQAR